MTDFNFLARKNITGTANVRDFKFCTLPTGAAYKVLALGSQTVSQNGRGRAVT